MDQPLRGACAPQRDPGVIVIMPAVTTQSTPSSRRRAIRELALQVLYQLDARAGEADGAADIADPGQTIGPDDRMLAMKLADRAYHLRERADALTSELAPTWPASRQPAVDRALLRLAYCEMVTQTAPAKVVINEAVELAKLYSTEKSPAFINGVLDKIMKKVKDQPPVQTEPGDASGDQPPSDPWLADALTPKQDDQ